jgi:hypothetical protein
MSAGKGSKNRLKGDDLKKYDQSPLWDNLNKSKQKKNKKGKKNNGL